MTKFNWIVAGFMALSVRCVPAQELLMISDIHLDPLDASEAARVACPGEGTNLTPRLLREAMNEAKHVLPNPRFVVLGGDYLAHGLQCRYLIDHPGASAAEYEDYALQNVKNVVGMVKDRYPATPVLVALGNHDSGCGNYRQTSGDRFLLALADMVAEVATDEPQRQKQIRTQFAAGGYFEFQVEDGPTILVTNTTPMAAKYRECSGGLSADRGDRQLAWVANRLARGRELRRKVWLVGHIPPGIDPRATLWDTNVCMARSVTTFMAGGQLIKTLADYGDVLALAIFGHTHMTEMRLLRGQIPALILPALTPVAGNHPGFTVGRYDPVGGDLVDYTVHTMSSEQDGAWRTSVSFREMYGLPSFSGPGVASLAERLQRDRNGRTSESLLYIDAFSAGSHNPASSLLHRADRWAAYACALSRFEVGSYLNCACEQEKSASDVKAPHH